MTIRRYADADLEGVALLFTDAVHQLTSDHYDAAQRLAWAPRSPDVASLRERLAGLTTLVAERAGALQGFIAFDDHGYVDFLFVSPEHARDGVATRLYAEAEATLLAANVPPRRAWSRARSSRDRASW